MMKKLMFGALAAAALAVSVPASAAPITGEIRTSGEIAATPTNNLGTATGLNFLSGFTLSGDGTYANVQGGLTLTYIDFQFNPFPAGGVVPLWTFTDPDDGKVYSFNMTSLTIVTQSSTLLSLQGRGTLFATGFDNTPGRWAFSTQSAGGDEAMRFSFSADTRPVPEPGSLALLGLGLLGLGAARRRKV